MYRDNIVCKEIVKQDERVSLEHDKDGAKENVMGPSNNRAMCIAPFYNSETQERIITLPWVLSFIDELCIWNRLWNQQEDGP